MEKKEWGLNYRVGLYLGMFIGVISFFLLWGFFAAFSFSYPSAFALFGATYIACLSGMLLIKESERYRTYKNKQTYEKGSTMGAGGGFYTGIIILILYFCLTGWTVFGWFFGLNPSDVYYNGTIDFLGLLIVMALSVGAILLTCCFTGMAGGLTGAIIRKIIKY